MNSMVFLEIFFVGGGGGSQYCFVGLFFKLTFAYVLQFPILCYHKFVCVCVCVSCVCSLLFLFVYFKERKEVWR